MRYLFNAYWYDSVNRVSVIQQASGSLQRQYRYDQLGRLDTVAYRKQLCQTWPGTLNALYGWSNTCVPNADSVQAYSYDAVGNRTGVLVNVTPALADVAVYHCQQSAEKAFKAFLFHNDVIFRKTHDLAELGEVCARSDASLADIVDRAIDLTPFAWQFRYPAEGRGDPTIEDAREAIEVAQTTYDAIRARLSSS